MNQRQNVFALGIGAVLGSAGAVLATNAITDWSLATVGLGLMAIATIQSLQQTSTRTADDNRNNNRNLLLLQELR